jgi:hypothetical protein
MATWSIVKKLFVGTGALVLLLLVSGAIAFQGSSSVEAQLDTVLHRTVPKITIALQIQENAVELRGEQRRVLLAAFTQEPQRLQESSKIIDDVAAESAKLLDGGYASIDKDFGGLNADKFHKGSRVFANVQHRLFGQVSASAYYPHWIDRGFAVPIAQRFDLAVSWNALPAFQKATRK